MKWMTNRIGVVGVLAFAAVAGGQPAHDYEAALRARRSAVVEAVARSRDSVVNISSTQRVRARRPSILGFLLDDIFEYPKTTSGSGVVIHADGYIVTNDHVVARSADHQVTFADGRKYDARVISRSPSHDLAVLKIDPEEALTPLALGRSDDLMVGEDVVAIGNPFGLENTVTRGVVSAVNREVRFSDEVVYRDLIQTDASINPGNSGGPLLNILGELIGINTAIRVDADNVGFAIPVDHLRAVLPDMLDITKLRQVQLGMRVEGDQATVVAVVPGSPADRAGVKIGDVLREVGGRPIGRDVDFYISMLGRGPDDVVPMKLVRSGRPRRVKVRLLPVAQLDGAELAWNKLGIRFKELSRRTARRYGVRRNAGMLVVDVDERGPVGRRGVQRGDLLVEVGPYRVSNLEQMGVLLEEVEGGDPVDIEFFRFNGDGMYDRVRQRLIAR